MLITTTNDGVTAVISPRGEIDFDALPRLLTAARELPHSFTQITWDLRQALFMDVAGLHLLIHQRLACLCITRAQQRRDRASRRPRTGTGSGRRRVTRTTEGWRVRAAVRRGEA